MRSMKSTSSCHLSPVACLCRRRFLDKVDKVDEVDLGWLVNEVNEVNEVNLVQFRLFPVPYRVRMTGDEFPIRNS